MILPANPAYVIFLNTLSIRLLRMIDIKQVQDETIITAPNHWASLAIIQVAWRYPLLEFHKHFPLSPERLQAHVTMCEHKR